MSLCVLHISIIGKTQKIQRQTISKKANVVRSYMIACFEDKKYAQQCFKTLWPKTLNKPNMEKHGFMKKWGWGELWII